jgi:hypothetical protein
MDQADSVHSTPPINTSANNPLESPDKPQEPSYLPTDISPEEVFQAIGRLRKEARDEIDRLIRFLDKTDDYVSRELEDAVDDGPIDDNELDGPEHGEDEESDPPEPSLGSVGDMHFDQTRWAGGGRRDLEDEHDGAEPDECGEPSLGSLDRITNQERSWRRENPCSIDMEEGAV